LLRESYLLALVKRTKTLVTIFVLGACDQGNYDVIPFQVI